MSNKTLQNQFSRQFASSYSNHSNRRGRGIAKLVALLITGFLASNVQAITITGNFLSTGTAFPNTNNAFIAQDPGNVAGGGDLQAIFNHAAKIWGDIITDGPNLIVNYGWLDLKPYGGGSAATYNNLQNPFPATNVNMAFTNASDNLWFMDPTPNDNLEYGPFSNIQADLGGGQINIGHEASALVDTAAVDRQDMFTVILHELAHALGFGGFPGTPDPLPITAPRLYSGTMIDLLVNDPAHLNADRNNNNGDLFDDALMQPSTHRGIRRLPSQVDILAVQEIRACTDVRGSNPNLRLACGINPVPEPGSLALLTLGLAGLGVARRKRALKKASD